MGNDTLGKIGIIVLKIYNPLRNSNELETLPNANNEGTIEMLQEGAGDVTLRDGKVLTMASYKFKDIVWKYLDSQRQSH